MGNDHIVASPTAPVAGQRTPAGFWAYNGVVSSGVAVVYLG